MQWDLFAKSNRLLMAKQKLYVLAENGWTNTFQRPHHLVKRFKNDYWVEVVAHLKYIPVVYSYGEEQLQIPDKIHTIYGLTGATITPFLDKVNLYLHDIQMKRILNSRSFRSSKVVYSWRTSDISYLNYCRDKILVYDGMDDWAEFFSDSDKKKKIRDNELEILSNAKLVLAVSQKLFDYYKEKNKNTILVRNGVDLEHFSSCIDHVKTPDDELYQFRDRPVIGYMGHITAWFDTTLVIETAKLLPHYLFVMIGPGSPDLLADLKKCSNIIVMGYKPYHQLPAIVSYFSAGIIPFRLNLLNESTNPIKLYEYLGAGIPVVSTGIKEVSLYENEGVVHIANDPVTFAAALEKASALTGNPHYIHQRIMVAKENSWDTRANDIFDAINRLI